MCVSVPSLKIHNPYLEIGFQVCCLCHWLFYYPTRRYASVWTLSADHSLFLIATHPEEMVNHPEEDSIRIHPPKDQNAHIYCAPGQGSIVNCLDFGTGFSF